MLRVASESVDEKEEFRGNPGCYKLLLDEE